MFYFSLLHLGRRSMESKDGFRLYAVEALNWLLEPEYAVKGELVDLYLCHVQKVQINHLIPCRCQVSAEMASVHRPMQHSWPEELPRPPRPRSWEPSSGLRKDHTTDLCRIYIYM